MRPGGPAVTEERWAELVRGWFPELSDTRLRQMTWPAIEAHHEYIREQLKAAVSRSTGMTPLPALVLTVRRLRS
jgi:hypothetical protein